MKALRDSFKVMCITAGIIVLFAAAVFVGATVFTWLPIAGVVWFALLVGAIVAAMDTI